MPEKKTKQRAGSAKRKGKAPSTQAGEFVREEIHHVREGKHGARSPKQAIAIGLSKARRAGVNVKPKKSASPATRKKAAEDVEQGRKARGRRPSPKRSRAVKGALQREGKKAASREALSQQGRSAAKRRKPAERRAAARKGAQTKSPSARTSAAKKGAATRARRTTGRSQRPRRTRGSSTQSK